MIPRTVAGYCGDEMRIEVRRRGSEQVILISFNTCGEKFESNSERNKFFRSLYGWEQVVPGNERQYRYHRPGLLDDIPHMKVSDSVFIVAMEHMKRMQAFFRQWSDKVECEMTEMMMKHMDARRLRAMNSGNTLNNDRKKRIDIE